MTCPIVRMPLRDSLGAEVCQDEPISNFAMYLNSCSETNIALVQKISTLVFGSKKC